MKGKSFTEWARIIIFIIIAVYAIALLLRARIQSDSDRSDEVLRWGMVHMLVIGILSVAFVLSGAQICLKPPK